MTKTWDEKSEELARHFLSPYPKASKGAIEELASEIQCSVEDWIGRYEDELKSGA
jgi:hypothetical protein